MDVSTTKVVSPNCARRILHTVDSIAGDLTEYRMIQGSLKGFRAKLEAICAGTDSSARCLRPSGLTIRAIISRPAPESEPESIATISSQIYPQSAVVEWARDGTRTA